MESRRGIRDGENDGRDCAFNARSRRCYRGVGMPDAAEVHPLVLQLDHRRDQRTIGQSFHLWVFHWPAELPGEGELLLWGEFLVAEEDHQMFEEGLADLHNDFAFQRSRDINVLATRNFTLISRNVLEQESVSGAFGKGFPEEWVREGILAPASDSELSTLDPLLPNPAAAHGQELCLRRVRGNGG